jgi:putative transposase
VAGVQGAGHRLVSGTLAGDRSSLASGIRADNGTILPSAIACFDDDFEACVPSSGHAPTSHANDEPARTAVRRGAPALKIIHNCFGEESVLKLMFGALIRAAKRWRGLRFADRASSVGCPAKGTR